MCRERPHGGKWGLSHVSEVVLDISALARLTVELSHASDPRRDPLKPTHWTMRNNKSLLFQATEFQSDMLYNSNWNTTSLSLIFHCNVGLMPEGHCDNRVKLTPMQEILTIIIISNHPGYPWQTVGVLPRKASFSQIPTPSNHVVSKKLVCWGKQRLKKNTISEKMKFQL